MKHRGVRHDDGTLDYRHCLLCGSRLESRVVMSHDPPRLVCVACGFVFYLDPKVAVGTICRQGDGLILMRRAIGPGYGKWVFPGGYVDRGETLMDAARREALEEINAEIRVRYLVNAYSYQGSPVVVIVYAADVIGGELRRGDEALEIRTYRPGEIPWDELAFRSTREGLRDYLANEGMPVVR